MLSVWVGRCIEARRLVIFSNNLKNTKKYYIIKVFTISGVSGLSVVYIGASKFGGEGPIDHISVKYVTIRI